MKATINGKRYNTDKCEVLGVHRHYNYNNNYSGTTRLLRAADGKLLIWTDANGQDLYLSDALYAYPGYSDWAIEDFEMDEGQEARCAELRLITIV